MERREFGDTGMEVSVLGFGGAWIGDPKVSDAAVRELLDLGLDSGLNVVDTAPVYGGSEERLGQAMGGRRERLLLFGKCGETADAGLAGEDWTADAVRRSVDRSLRRLRTDRLDLLTIHSCDRAVLERGEVVEAARRAKSEGKTRFVAYSGDNDALAYAVDLEVFDGVMASVNVADQANLPILGRAAAAGLGIVAKRPIANAAWMRVPDENDYGRTYWERLGELRYPDLDLALALRWTLAQPVHTAIVGMDAPEQWRQDVGALAGGPLPEEEVERVRARWREVAPADWIGLT